MADTAKARPGTMRLADATQYRLPLAGIVSILHRLSGLLLLALLPFLLWLFDLSLSSEASFARLQGVFRGGAWGLPGFVFKLVSLALIWAYLHHFLAGARHVWMDFTHSVSKAQGHTSAVAVLIASLLLTLVLGARLFGLF